MQGINLQKKFSVDSPCSVKPKIVTRDKPVAIKSYSRKTRRDRSMTFSHIQYRITNSSVWYINLAAPLHFAALGAFGDNRAPLRKTSLIIDTY